MAHRGSNLGELLDGVANLLVQNPTVGDHDDGVEDWRAVSFETDQLMGQPSDGVRLAAPGRVLDQVAFPGAMPAGVRQQPPHYVELVVSRPDLHFLGLLGPLVLLDADDLGVVLQNVGQAVTSENVGPQIGCLEAVRIRRVPSAVLPTSVERQEPGALALEMGTELHLVVVHGEVRHAPAEREQRLARVSVALVLLDGVLDGLFGQAVLQLERGDRQAVDEERKVQGALGLGEAVAELPRDRETVLAVALSGEGIAGRRRAVEEIDLVLPVLEAPAEEVDGAALADLALQAGEELAAGGAILLKPQPLVGVGLGFPQESQQLREVDRELAVVLGGVAADPPGSSGLGGGLALAVHPLLGAITGISGQGDADQPLQAAFAGVSRHWASRPAIVKFPSSKLRPAQPIDYT